MEHRRVLAAAIWNNLLHPVNVNGDVGGVVSPIDALLVINELNQRVHSDRSSGLLPKQLNNPNVPFLDVSCDGFVTPLDALIVINTINAGGGGSRSSGGLYANAACSPQLAESTDFHTQLSQTIALPNKTSAIKVSFQAPKFDFTSRRSIRDAFEIDVTDLAGNPVSLPYAAGRKALYNWSEDFEPVFGPAVATVTHVQGQDSSATINLAGLAAGTSVRVTVRLVTMTAITTPASSFAASK